MKPGKQAGTFASAVARVACIVVLCVLNAARPAWGGAEEERERRWQQLEEAAEYDPHGSIEKGKLSLRLARATGNKPAELDALLLLSVVRSNIDESAPEDEAQGEALARKLNDMQALAWYLEGKAWTAWNDARYADADRLWDEAGTITEACGMETRRAWSDFTRGQLKLRNGSKAAAIELMTRSYNTFSEKKDRYAMAAALAAIGNVYAGPEENKESQAKAAEYFERAAALFNRSVHRVSMMRTDLALGLTQYRRKDAATARRYLARALETARLLGLPKSEARIHFHLADVFKDEGEFAASLAHADAALAILANFPDKHLIIGSHITRAEVLAASGQKSPAITALSSALELLHQLRSPASLVQYYRRIADTFARLGEYREAFRQMQALRDADARLANLQNAKLDEELKIRFDVRLKDAENAMLRAEQREAEVQRTLTLLALALSLLLAVGIAYVLRKRAAIARREAQHHKALADAESLANQAKSTFLANMSHELRSPLNAVLGFARILARDQRLPADARRDLDIALRSGEHLYALINQVLDLSKIESGHAVPVPTDFDLRAVLDELAGMFGIVAARKRLRLVIHADPGVPHYLRADVVKLRQVLINLIENALKFTDSGSVALHVSSDGSAPACRVSFVVVDTGPGIAADEIGRLGAAFIQAEAGRRSREGTGLGLAISRGFVQLMGGNLHIDSTIGSGTEVTCEIPMQVVAIADKPSMDAGAHRGFKLAASQRRYRVLAVEDRADSRALLVRQLAPSGFDVREAADGKQAIEIWKAWQPDLVLMDIRMPGMDGREATRQIRSMERERHTVIIALTASSFEDEREQVLADGCDDFLRKPFHEAALFGLIRRHLGVSFDDSESVSVAARPIDASMLTGLPRDLLARLSEALERLDVVAIEQAIVTIGAHDAVLGEGLANMARNFDYEGILALMPSP